MANLFSWIKTKADRIFDPNRESRLTQQAAEMWSLLREQRNAFDYSRACLLLGVEAQDRTVLAERIFREGLQKVWRDGQMDAKERESAAKLGHLLGVDKDRQHQLHWEAFLPVFAAAFEQASTDGHLDDREWQRLDALAEHFSLSAKAVFQHAFPEQSREFLLRLFLDSIAGGQFDEARWQHLVHTADAIGVTSEELRALIEPQARQHVEHALSDAKNDGRVDAAEHRWLRWLMEAFDLPATYRHYVEGEIAAVNDLANIRAGHLPVIEPPGFLLRAGELAHYYGPCRYSRARLRRGQAVQEVHDGQLTITDTRMLFASPLLNLELNHRKVIGFSASHIGVDVQSGGKGSGYYALVDNPQRAILIYWTAIGRANQTIVAKSEGLPSRHIPRDVRQRVWQTYGGRCADCGATDYLEFDHIIPHARGGSNDERNVQLLCRRCNLRKSDAL